MTPGLTDARKPADPQERFGKPDAGWRRALYQVIFESDSHAGRTFDIVLLFAILASVVVVMLDSVEPIARENGRLLNRLEWIFTVGFSIEYLARVLCVKRPVRYMTSFFGIIDLLSVVPSFLALTVPGLELLLDIRILRLLRIFRIFKLAEYIEEYGHLGTALVASRRKILVFLSVVMMIVLVMGTVMYLVEGPEHGFTSIPTAVYWAITAVTTVGFGDLVPKTNFGRTIASMMMLVGWGILAVPTGIISSEMTAQRYMRDRELDREGSRVAQRSCPHCGSTGHVADAKYCKDCGQPMDAA